MSGVIMASAPALSRTGDRHVAVLGAWTAAELSGTGPAIAEGTLAPETEVIFDLSEIETLDMFGAATLTRMMEDMRNAGSLVSLTGATPRQNRLLETVSHAATQGGAAQGNDENLPITALGKMVVEAGSDAVDITGVEGHILVSAFDLVTGRGPVRLAAVINQFQEIVLKAIPIVGLISLVVGIILTQQSISQLRTFGATIFVVDLGGILMLREIGILLAAIMVAGRSGSAITAEIGAMRMREEIDALEVIGLDTYRAVVLPRVLALVFGMPALALVGAIAGIIGAALVARISGGISLESFVSRLQDVVDFHIIAVGVVKAPIMAFAVAVIAVSEGLRVAGSTQSLGRHTTASVVKAIFIVIVLDGLFAIFFEAIGF